MKPKYKKKINILKDVTKVTFYRKMSLLRNSSKLSELREQGFCLN